MKYYVKTPDEPEACLSGVDAEITLDDNIKRDENLIETDKEAISMLYDVSPKQVMTEEEKLESDLKNLKMELNSIEIAFDEALKRGDDKEGIENITKAKRDTLREMLSLKMKLGKQEEITKEEMEIGREEAN